MKAGRELDILIAENVMKLTRVTETDIFADLNTGPHFPALVLPKYSTDIAAAWEVVEHFSGRYTKIILSKHAGRGYFLSIYSDGDQKGDQTQSGFAFPYQGAETAPHAICLAALRAVGYELP